MVILEEARDRVSRASQGEMIMGYSLNENECKKQE